jgi:HK97 family phage prohead protease
VTSSGLHYAATLPETAEARELYEAIKDGRLSHSSFAFTIAEEEWEPRMKLRRITRIGEVLDVSPVSFPAYVETSVEAGPGVV